MENKIILAIVDDIKTLNLLKDNVLEPMGFDVITAADEKLGLESALVNNPELILISTKTGAIPTNSIVSILRQSGLSTPIILVSNTGHDQLLDAFRMGINDFISIPIIVPEAQNVVARMIEKSKLNQDRDKYNQKLLLDEAVRITLTTLSHYLNNYLTALDGDLVLLAEAVQNKDPIKDQMEALKKSQRDAAYIKKVIEVLINTTSIKLTEYDKTAKMLDIDASLFNELNLLLDVGKSDIYDV